MKTEENGENKGDFIQKMNVSLEEFPKDEVKTATQPLGRKAVSSFSIKKHLEGKKEEEPQQKPLIQEELPDNHFSDTDLQTEWTKFLKELLSSNNMVTWNAINGFKLVKISENQIQVNYSSDSAKKEFETIEGDFFNHFKHKVNNFRIEVIYQEDISLRKEVLNKRKIFEQYMEINPVLRDLEDLMRFDFS